MREGVRVAALVRAAAAIAGFCAGAGQGRALAQSPTAGGTPACAIAPPAPRPVLDTLFAWVPYQGAGETALQADYRIDQEQAALRFLPPIPVLDSGADPDQAAKPLPAPDGLDDAATLVWFQVRNDGRLDGLSLERWSGWRALDRALPRAVLRADSARVLKPLPDSLEGEGLDLWLAAGTRRLAHAVNVPIAYYRSVAYPAGAVVEPRLRHLGHEPRFPAAGLRADVGDSVVMEVVVDTSGRVEPGSIRFLHATWREYALEALKAIKSARFEPGRVDGCAVPMRLRFPFTFTVDLSP